MLEEDADFFEKRHEVPNIAAMPPITIKAEELPPFPFTALVGQTHMKKAILLALSNPAIHTVLLMGDRDTGKGTAINTGATFLPEEVGFVEMPLNVTRVQLFGGTTKNAGGEVKVTGLVDQATDGYLFVERINLFDDGTIEKILESASTKQYTLFGTANLEDGEFPDEFMDTIDLVVTVNSLKDIEERIEILKRLEGFRKDPKSFYQTYASREQNLVEKIQKARELVASVELSKQTVKEITKACKKAGKEGKEEALRKATAANAAFEGRAWADTEDVEEVVSLVLLD